MKSNVWYLVYYKTNEILIGSLVIAFYFIFREQDLPILNYLILAIPATYLFIFMIHRYQEKSRLLFFLIVLPFIVIGGLWLHFSILFGFVLSILIYWRTTILNDDSDHVQTGFWLFLSIFLGFLLLIYANMRHYPYQNLLMFIIILNFAFILIGGFLINWVSVVGNTLVKKRLLKNFLSIIGILTVISLFLAAIRDVFIWVVSSILNLVVFAVSFVMSPMFNWVENYELTGKMNPFEQMQNKQLQMKSDGTSLIHDPSSIGAKVDFNFTYLYLPIFIILGFLVFFFLYKKFQGSTEVLDSTENGFYYSTNDDGERRSSSSNTKRDGKQPSYRVRKEIYRLEKLADKLQLGRNSSETIGEWFNRIGIKEDESIQSVYERVRYGNQFESEEEYKLFLKGMETKKTELKQLQKLLKEEGKIQSSSRVKKIIKGFTSRSEEQ